MLCTPKFIAALFTVDKREKQAKCPSVGERIKKVWYVHTVGCYLAMKSQSAFVGIFMTYYDKTKDPEHD